MYAEAGKSMCLLHIPHGLPPILYKHLPLNYFKIIMILIIFEQQSNKNVRHRLVSKNMKHYQSSKNVRHRFMSRNMNHLG